MAPTEPLPSQPQNLIGLQLPESGEVLFLDPNDPAAQQLLQEAGISLGDNGVLQTLEGQVLQGEHGNPITVNTSKAPAMSKKDDTPQSYDCPYPNCDKAYRRKSSLNEHIQGIHKEGFKCSCGKFHPYRNYKSRCKKKDII